MLGPRLEKMVGGHSGKVLLAKVDIDELGDLAMDYNVCKFGFSINYIVFSG
jgi:thioredoxin-like negative regulator of GroEL